MSLSATLFGTNSLIFKATNILGLGIPGLLHKTFTGGNPSGPPPQKLGDIAQQTAKEGGPRVIVWGMVRPIGGNIIHVQKPVKKMVKVGTAKTGKGGGKKKKQDQYAEHVFRSYAIGVCEGPITGFRRIWRNNKLVYDARGTDWGARNNGVFLKNFRLYTGSWAQMPDPTLQSIWGSVPAYRGTAYMVAVNEDLTEMGGSVPQWQFEVWRAEGVFLTSTLYPVEFEDALTPMALAPALGWRTPPMDIINVDMLAPSVRRTSTVRYLSYTDAEPESLSVGVLAPSVSRQTLVRYLAYDKAEPESLSVGILAPNISRQTVAGYVDYTIDPESLEVAMIAPTIKRTTV